MDIPLPDSPFEGKKHRAWVTGLVFGSVALVLISAGIYMFTRSQRTGILILGDTSNVSITLNGKAVQTETDSKGLLVPLYAGQYRLVVSKTGYQPFTKDITTVPGTVLEIRPLFALIPETSSVVKSNIDFVRPSPDQKSLYYLGDSRQRLYRLDVDTQTVVPLNQEVLSGVTDVQWSSDPKLTIITQNNGVYLLEIPLFNFEKQQYLKISDSNLGSPVWDPNNSSRIAASYKTSLGESSLILSDRRLTSIQRLADLRALTNPKVIWSPDSNYLLLLSQSPKLRDNNLWIYTLADGTLKQLTQEGGVQEALFRPDSEAVIYSYNSDNGLSNARALVQISDAKVTKVAGNGPVTKLAWIDRARYFEVSNGVLEVHYLEDADGNLITEDKKEALTVSLPSNDPVQQLFYFSNHHKLLLATNTTVLALTFGTAD